jgi:hypothetical protein
MEDWAKRIDIILEAGGDAVLHDSGKVSAEFAKINLPRYFMDSSYRKAQTGVKKYSKALVHHIASELNITEINLNSFYDNYDRIMEYLLIGPGRTYLLSSIKKDSDKLWQVYKKYRHLTFCNYIKVPNRYNAIIERSGKESYSAKGQLETTQLYYALADTLKSDEYHDLGPKDHLRNADIVGKVTIALADQYTRSKGNNHTNIFHKTALSRKHVAAGHWQLLEFTTKADNEVHPCERIYYSIQLWVVEVAEKQGPQGLTPFRGRYQYDEASNSITMNDMSTYDLPENSRPAEVWELEPYGLNNVNTTFKVVETNGKYMTLESDYAILKFKKF